MIHSEKKKFTSLGLMSGTSLDGVDLALCVFKKQGEKWSYVIEEATTISYPDKWLNNLKAAEKLSGLELSLFDNQLGAFYGLLINDFLNGKKVDLIASHGHTIFHQPEIAFTKQIGSGAAIYAKTGIPTACDFRSVDVHLGGQGAPLVPLGDSLLFSEYDYCINLGGIANISSKREGKVIAYDICPVNQVFNYIATKLGRPYDTNGEIARGGNLIPDLLSELNQLAFYSLSSPKSLGKEWVDEHVISRISAYPLEDFQHTFAHHVANQLIKSIPQSSAKVLLSGGGAYNQFLIELLKAKAPQLLFNIPGDMLVSFKEALIFAFLGILGTLGQPTSLASVTGAKKSSISMAQYGFIN